MPRLATLSSLLLSSISYYSCYSPSLAGCNRTTGGTERRPRWSRRWYLGRRRKESSGWRRSSCARVHDALLLGGLCGWRRRAGAVDVTSGSSGSPGAGGQEQVGAAVVVETPPPPPPAAYGREAGADRTAWVLARRRTDETREAGADRTNRP